MYDEEYSHKIAGPVIELISISIREDGNDEISYKIYGTIQLTDGEGFIFDLYDRKDDNPETISNGGTLTLTLPHDRAITPSKVLKLTIDLKDSSTGAEVVKGFFDWDCMAKDQYDKVRHTEVFNGNDSSVIVDYVTYRHAVVGNIVDVILNKKEDDDISTSVNVYGKIAVRCGSNFPTTVLFDKKQNESVKVKYGTPMKLPTYVLVAPAVSSLEMDVNICIEDTQEQIVGTNKIPVYHWGVRGNWVSGQNSRIELYLNWSHPYAQPVYEEAKRELFTDQQPSSAMGINRELPYGYKLIEIFSVSIAGHRVEDMDLWGSIKFCFTPQRRRIFLFHEDKTSPQRLLPYQIVPTTTYTESLEDIAFSVFTDLRDVNGRAISLGDMIWNERFFERYLPLLNRLLCSVIQGADGYYAAVHYLIFSTGVMAIVKIYLNDKNSNMKRFKVDGSVCAQYSNYDYSTLYHKEYYRKKLFLSKTNEPWLHYTSSSLLLSESAVMVPKGSALMLDVNLKVIYPSTETTLGDDGNNSDEVLQIGDSFIELLEFKINDMGCSREPKILEEEIKGSSQQLLVHVEWR